MISTVSAGELTITLRNCELKLAITLLPRINPLGSRYVAESGKKKGEETHGQVALATAFAVRVDD